MAEVMSIYTGKYVFLEFIAYSVSLFFSYISNMDMQIRKKYIFVERIFKSNIILQ